MKKPTPEFIEGMFYAICQKQATNADVASIMSHAKSIKDVVNIIRSMPKAMPFMNQYHGLSCNWMDHLFCVGQQPSHFQAICLAYTGVNRFVDLTEIEQDYFEVLPDNVSYYKTPIANDTPNHPAPVIKAVGAVMETLQKNQRVYLHCQSGFSRSALIASVVMAIRLKISFSDAMKVVKTRRPVAQPQLELLRREDAELVIENFNANL